MAFPFMFQFTSAEPYQINQLLGNQLDQVINGKDSFKPGQPALNKLHKFSFFEMIQMQRIILK